MRHQTLTSVLMAAGAVTLAAIPSNIDPAHKFSWDENSGWMNWLDADGGASGVVVLSDHLSGYIWSENNGWINVGNGGGPYANTDDTNYGVNILADTDLDGFAWDENGGWINFGWGAVGDLAGRAQFDGTRFRGYAWGENDGWINLDDATHFVATVSCTDDAVCEDGDDCTTDTCDPGDPEASGDGCVHEYQVQVYADICLPYDPPNGPQPDLDDILCELDDFADGSAVDGCACDGFRKTTDLHPCPEDGGGDGALGLDDILKMLDAFAGQSPCDDPCP